MSRTSAPRIGAEIDLATSLALVGAAVDAHVMESLHAAGLEGLRRGHGFIVQRLVDSPSTVGETAVALGVTQQAVSKSVRELVELGYVEQHADPVDRRRRPVRLTRRGRRAVEVSRRTRQRLSDQVAAGTSDLDVAATLRVLSAAADALGLTEQLGRRAVAVPRERT